METRILAKHEVGERIMPGAPDIELQRFLFSEVSRLIHEDRWHDAGKKIWESRQKPFMDLKQAEEDTVLCFAAGNGNNQSRWTFEVERFFSHSHHRPDLFRRYMELADNPVKLESGKDNIMARYGLKK
jgi:hypothetical protein